jgi:hypothetical protein
MRTISEIVEAKVADEAWIFVALLHREHPERTDFSLEEIMERATKEAGKHLRPGVYVHVVQHCVANRPPNPGRYRMLVESAPGRRRLFVPGDSYHARREGSKTMPRREELPEEYRSLLDWYKNWSRRAEMNRIKHDPLLALRGSGKHIWADEHADEYIRRLREGWE